MKLVFAIPRLTYSGAPKMMAWIASQMAAKGHEVHLTTFFSEEQARILHEGVRVHNLGLAQSKSRFIRNSLGMVKTIRRLHSYVKKVKPDIFVSFLDSVGYVYLPIGHKFGKCKIVSSERVDPYSYHGRKAQIRFRLMKYAHGTVFQTKGAQEFFKNEECIYKNSAVIPNPVVLSEATKALSAQRPKYEERDNRIVTVGRLSVAQKRQDLLLEAFAMVHKVHPELELVIYGDGQDKNKIQALIDEAGLGSCVTLAGRTDEVEKNIYNARAFVLTSDFEGIPNALIEAMSLGMPSISTDCSPGGAALLIRDGENGYIVPRGDAKAVADRLLAVVENREIAEAFSKNAPEIATEFSEEVIADMWENYFREISGEKNG